MIEYERKSPLTIWSRRIKKKKKKGLAIALTKIDAKLRGFQESLS